jgi:hypothetical protein
LGKLSKELGRQATMVAATGDEDQIIRTISFASEKRFDRSGASNIISRQQCRAAASLNPLSVAGPQQQTLDASAMVGGHHPTSGATMGRRFSQVLLSPR